jgi:hypothetical protein
MRPVAYLGGLAVALGFVLALFGVKAGRRWVFNALLGRSRKSVAQARRIAKGVRTPVKTAAARKASR